MTHGKRWTLTVTVDTDTWEWEPSKQWLEENLIPAAIPGVEVVVDVEPTVIDMRLCVDCGEWKRLDMFPGSDDSCYLCITEECFVCGKETPIADAFAFGNKVMCLDCYAAGRE